MPNRILKESITTSETVAQLTGDEWRCFSFLMVVADDFGRFDGRRTIIRGRCFALYPTVTDNQVGAWLGRLQAVGLIEVYEVEGKPYVQLRTWADHQTVRAKHSKYPAPSEDIRTQMQADASKCEQTHADVPVFVFGNGNGNDVGAASVADAPAAPTPPEQPGLIPDQPPVKKPRRQPGDDQERQDGDRWIARAYAVAGLPMPDHPWTGLGGAYKRFRVARREQGIDALMRSLDGLDGDPFARSAGIPALLSEALISKGLARAAAPEAIPQRAGAPPAAPAPRPVYMNEIPKFAAEDAVQARNLAMTPEQRRAAREAALAGGAR